MEKTNLEKIIDTFISSLDLNSNPDKKNLQYHLNMAYKTHNKKYNKKSTQPRQPSKYNEFVKQKMEEFKESEPILNSREKMKKIGTLWQEYKNSIPMN